MNININSSELASLTQKLERDNIRINDIVLKINSLIKELDNTLWISREKTNLDSTLESFMQENDNKLLSYLNECTELLKVANQAYQSNDKALTNNITNS